jgi:ribonuclease P protein component
MISRSHRFHGYASVRRVYRTSQTVRSPLIILKYVRNNRRASYRAAVVVSRKVHKSAVVRNRIRRRIYEIIRQQPQLETAPYDLVFTVYSDQLADRPAMELQQAISQLLTKAGIGGKESAATGDRHAIVDHKDLSETRGKDKEPQ